MVAISTLLGTAVAAISVPALARPAYNCDWMGCSLQTVLSSTIDNAAADSEVVAGIDGLTATVAAMQPIAASITVLNAPLLVAGFGPYIDIIKGYQQFISSGVQLSRAFQDMKPIADKDAGPYVEAWRSYTISHKLLLQVLTGKAGITDSMPVVRAPIEAMLRQVEQIHDTLLFGLLDVVVTKANELQETGGEVATAIDTALVAHASY